MLTIWIDFCTYEVILITIYSRTYVHTHTHTYSLTSISTLRYANSAKHIKVLKVPPSSLFMNDLTNLTRSVHQTRAVVNEDPTASMISRLQAEVERLRSLLTCTESETQQQGGGGSGGGNFGAMRKESHGQIAAIEGKIREQQISLARRDNLDKSNMPSRRLVWGMVYS